MTTQKWQSKRSAVRWTPKNYAKRAVKFLLDHDEAALFLDPGLGKTSITYAALALKKKHGNFGGALVVAPLRPARSVWPAEQQKWSDFKDLRVVLLHGAGKEQRALEAADVYVINPEGLAWLARSGLLLNMLKEKRLDTLVLDELSKWKHSHTQRFKLMKKFLPKFGVRWGLTGSPAANGLMGLFGQCYMLDLGKALGPYITGFRFTFFNQPQEHQWVPKSGAEQHIYERVRPLALRMSGEDYLELPEQLDHFLPFELPAKVRSLYDQLENEFYTQIDERLITAANSGVKAMKLRQIASGAVFTTDAEDELAALLPGLKGPRTYTELHDEKFGITQDLVEELQGQQLLVAYDFTHDLERAQRFFGKDSVPYIGGGVSGKKGDRLEQQWNAGELPWLWLHPQSAAHGLNLQSSNAAHLLWFTMTGNFELYDQLNRRLKRQGNEAKHIHCYHLYAKNTVDDVTRWTLRRRESGQNAFFQALQKRRAKTLPDLE